MSQSYFDVVFCQMPIDQICTHRIVYEKEIEKAKLEFDTGTPATLSVNDNGNGGDGCNVEVHMNPRTTDDKSLVFSFRIPDDQVPVFAEVFSSIVRLRQAQQAFAKY